ncbi:MAG: branched-chain amino acid ABC transporter permease [Desulfurococcales archaeon]|nr:branched-chain amino acid ABC transporter permease [Desulfurococcales archaeon]
MDPQVLISMVQIGLIYTILSVPLTLSYKSTKIINFVHINFITYGAYAGVLLATIGGVDNFFFAALLAFLVGGGISVLDNVAVFEPLRRRGANVVILMIASMGLWIFYKYLMYSILDVISRLARINLISQLVRFEAFPTIHLGRVIISNTLITSAVTVAVVMGGLYLILEKTALGKAIRAVADNPTLSEISGIPRGRVLNYMWFLAGGMAAVGGLLWVTFSIATPEVGDTLILEVFAIAVIGGLYSLTWTTAGAFIIATAETVGMALLNQYLGVPTSFKPFITFSTLLIVIIAFPPMGAGGGLPYRYLRRGGKK